MKQKASKMDPKIASKNVRKCEEAHLGHQGSQTGSISAISLPETTKILPQSAEILPETSKILPKAPKILPKTAELWMHINPSQLYS